MFKEIQMDLGFYRNLLPNVDDRTSTRIKFFNSGNTAVVKDLIANVETVAVINKTTKFNYIAVTNQNGLIRTFEVPLKELKSFLELDFCYTLDEDENPENIKAFVGETPIVFGLL